MSFIGRKAKAFLVKNEKLRRSSYTLNTKRSTASEFSILHSPLIIMLSDLWLLKNFTYGF